MDIEKWFKDGTNMEIKEMRWLVMPPFPYNVFFDDIRHRGADLKNNIVEHNIVIEHFNDTLNTEQEKTIENFLNLQKQNGKFGSYRKYKDWLPEEKIYRTVYEIDPFLEKIRKEN